MRWRVGVLALALPLAAATVGAADEPEALESHAASGPVEVHLRITPAAPVIGDALHLELEVSAEPGVELLMPEFGEALDRFTIVDFAPSETLADDGGTVARQRYTLQPSRSGPQSVPPLLIEFVDRRPGRPAAPEGSDAFELLTERLSFEVAGVLPDDAPLELRPAQQALGPRVAPGAPRWPWLVAAGVALAAGAPFAARSFLAWQSRRRRRSAHDIARADLDALLYGPRPDAATMDAFFVKLSSIVRRYLEDRFGLRSPELTTEEFIEVLTDSPDLVRSHRLLLQDFLRRADLVKFAHAVPAPAEVEESVEAAQRFLEETRGQARLEAAAGAAPGSDATHGSGASPGSDATHG